MERTRLDKIAFGLGLSGILALLAALYAKVAPPLFRDWWNDPDYTHGLLVIPLALWFVWERRADLQRAPSRPSPLGALLLAGGLSMLLVGTAGAEFFLQRSSFVVVVAGLVWLLLGGARLRVLAFPTAFLLFMVPLPAIVMNAVAFPLQLFAARTATVCLQGIGIPVLREGNVILLAGTSLEVAEACSGIRSLQALMALAAVYGYWGGDRTWKRWLLLVAAVPIAVVVNAARVTGTGLLVQYWGEEAAEGFYHSFEGWVLFLAALALLMGVGTLLDRIGPKNHKSLAQETP